jgi:hypothetical protein
MNRYNLHVEHPESEAMDCDSDGEWVRYADVKDYLKAQKEPVAEVPCSDGVMPEPCDWHHPDFEDYEHWTTKCGKNYPGFRKGGPHDNGMKFCCYCGGELIEM